MMKKEYTAGQAGAVNPDILSRSLERIAKHYTIYPARYSASQEIIDFFKTAYAGEYNAAAYRDDKIINDKWEWANIDNPDTDGSYPYAWICRENSSKKIVGHMGIIPISLKCKDKHYPAGWGRDLVVLPEYRRFGVGPFLVSSVLKEVKDRLAIFLIAGVREHVYPMYKKFGFTDMGRISLHVRINRPGNIIHSKLDIKILTPVLEFIVNQTAKLIYIPCDIIRYMSRKKEGVTIAEISRFDESFDRLWDSASATFPIIVRRDAAYLNWRFVDQPYTSYRIFKASDKISGEVCGYIVMRKGESRGLKVGIISDIFAADNRPDIVRAMVEHAVAYFAGMDDVALLRCDVLSKNIEKVLKRSGFIRVPSNDRFMFTNVREGLDASFINNPDNWFLDYSDSDLDLSGQTGA